VRLDWHAPCTEIVASPHPSKEATMSIRCQRVCELQVARSELPGRVGILIPAYNEAAHLPTLLSACRSVRPVLILVVDDASTDDTPRVLASLGGVEPTSGVPVRVLRNRRNLGKQGSVAHGLRALTEESLDAVALIDGDGQHDPAELPALAALLERHHLVVGARSRTQMPAQRRLSNWLVNRGFQWLGGVDFVDVQSGLRLYRKPLADLLARHLPSDGGYALEHESLAILAAWSSEQGVELSAVAAPIGCTYGIARSKMRVRNIVALGAETVSQALRIRRALAGKEPLSRPRALTVEVHDVSPATRLEVEAIVAALGDVGVERVTLLVVPSYLDERGRRWDLRDDPALVARLRGWQAAGSEIVQHGLTHRAPGPPPRGLANALMHHWFSRGCAEFAHLPREEAALRLLEGRRILEDCELRAEGFIAPAWQQSPAAIGVLTQLGYRFTAFLDHLLPFEGDPRPVPCPAITFAAPNLLVDRGKRLVMRGVEAMARPAPLLRVAVHPEDLHHGRPLPHILRRLRGLLRHRRAITYAEWLSERTAREAA
jgi:uncharacterized protein